MSAVWILIKDEEHDISFNENNLSGIRLNNCTGICISNVNELTSKYYV